MKHLCLSSTALLKAKLIYGKNGWLNVQGITEMHKNHLWNLYENINSKIWELPGHKSDLFLLNHLELNIQPEHLGEPKVTWWNVLWWRAS